MKSTKVLGELSELARRARLKVGLNEGKKAPQHQKVQSEEAEDGMEAAIEHLAGSHTHHRTKIKNHD